MIEAFGLVLYFAAHVVGLVMIPFGLPGTFVQLGAAIALTVLSDGARLGWSWVALFAVLALLGEVVEFLSGQWGARRFGGSRYAAWGALVGGIVGAIVGGVPVPVAGSMIASFVGTFLGAVAGEMYARRVLALDLKVGVGALVGRIVAVATKLSLAFFMLIVSAAVLFAQVLAHRGA
jgi:uncharacterized protein YqgC (DUF456 family)